MIKPLVSTRLIILLTLCFGAISCEKDVVLELANKEGNYLVVDANLTDAGGRQWIRLSLSSSYYEESKGKPASEATIWIEGAERKFAFVQSDADTLKGYYFNDAISHHLKDNTFELNIEYQGKIYQASSQWAPLPQIDSVTYDINPFSQLGFTPDTIYDITVHFRELPQKNNFYLFNLYVNDTLRTGRPTQKSLVSDENLEEYVSLAVQNISHENIRTGDAITLEMRSISRANFTFYSIFFSQTDLSGNPFAGAPPANIPTNLSEGALGFFEVSSVNKKTITFRSFF